jgi:hypothetical protein
MKIIVAILKFLIITAVDAIKFIAGTIIYLFRNFKMATIIFMFTNISGVFLCWAEESVFVRCWAVLLSAGHCRPPWAEPCSSIMETLLPCHCFVWWNI